jgi:hypothetical protein
MLGVDDSTIAAQQWDEEAAACSGQNGTISARQRSEVERSPYGETLLFITRRAGNARPHGQCATLAWVCSANYSVRMTAFTPIGPLCGLVPGGQNRTPCCVHRPGHMMFVRGTVQVHT